MPLTVQHVKNLTIADSTDTSLVRPSDWNSNHAITYNPTGAELIGAFSSNNQVQFSTNLGGAIVAAVVAAGTGFTGTNASATIDTNGIQLSVAAGGGGGAGTGFTTTTTGGTAIVGTLNSNGISMGVPTFQTAAGAGDGNNVLGVNGGATQASTTYQLSNANNVSFGLNAGTITASASYPTQTVQPVAFSAANGSANFSTITFANSNGVSFSTGTQGVYATVKTDYQSSNANYLTSQSNQAFSAANGSAAFQTLTFADSNGVSFSTGTQGLYASVAAQSVQPVAYSAANGSAAFSTITFANSNGVSFSTGTQGVYATVKTDYQSSNANYLTSQSGQAFSADASSTFQTLSFQNSNGVSFSNNAGALLITHDLQYTSATSAITSNAFPSANTTKFAGTGTSATNASITLNSNGLAISVAAPGGGGAINVSAGTTSGNLQTIQFNDGNGVTFGLDGSTITASANGGGGGSYNIVAMGTDPVGGGSTSGATFSTSAGSIYLQAGNNMTLSQTSNSIVFSALDANWYLTGANTAGTTSSNLSANKFYLSGGNNVTLSGNSNTIVISGPSQGTTFNGTNLGGSMTFNSAGLRIDINNTDDHIKGWSIYGNTSGTTSTQYTTTGGIYLAGGNNITLSGNSNSITISAAALGGTVAFSTNKSLHLPINMQHASLNTVATAAQASVQFHALHSPLSATVVQIPIVIGSVATAANASSGGVNMTASYVIATRNGSTLNSVSSSALTCFMSWSSNTTGAVTGTKLMTCPWNLTLPPGDYYHILYTSYAATGGGLTGANTTSLGASVSNISVIHGVAWSYAPFGASTNSTTGFIWGQGLNSSTGQLTNMSMSNITNIGSSAARAGFLVAFMG